MLQFNASIAKFQNKIWCAYQTKHLRHYNAECFLTELNSDFELKEEKKLIAENNNTAFDEIKLFPFGDKLWAFYNYLPFNESTGWKQEYGVGYGEVDILSGVIKDQISLRKYSKKSQEKNWMPYTWDNDLYILTDLSPFLRVIKISGDAQGELFLAQDETFEWGHGVLLGGTSLIRSPDNDGWLYGFAYSFKADEEGFKKRYYYTIIRFDHSNKRLEYHPTPLAYEDEETETEYELLWDHSNGKQHKGVVPTGIMDYDDGVIVSLSKDEVSSNTEYFSWERIKSYFS